MIHVALILVLGLYFVLLVGCRARERGRVRRPSDLELVVGRLRAGIDQLERSLGAALLPVVRVAAAKMERWLETAERP